MSPTHRYCTAEERRRGVVQAIVEEGGGQDRPYSDTTLLVEFYPGRVSLPEEVLARVREGIRRRCWCLKFREVYAELTIGQLQNAVYRQHRRQGGAVHQDGSPDQCCS